MSRGRREGWSPGSRKVRSWRWRIWGGERSPRAWRSRPCTRRATCRRGGGGACGRGGWVGCGGNGGGRGPSGGTGGRWSCCWLRRLAPAPPFPGSRTCRTRSRCSCWMKDKGPLWKKKKKKKKKKRLMAYTVNGGGVWDGKGGRYLNWEV